jgi:hypothetical protein
MSIVFVDWKTEIPEEVRHSSAIIRLIIDSGDFSIILTLVKISFEFIIANSSQISSENGMNALLDQINSFLM